MKSGWMEVDDARATRLLLGVSHVKLNRDMNE